MVYGRVILYNHFGSIQPCFRICLYGQIYGDLRCSDWFGRFIRRAFSGCFRNVRALAAEIVNAIGFACFLCLYSCQKPSEALFGSHLVRLSIMQESVFVLVQHVHQTVGQRLVAHLIVGVIFASPASTRPVVSALGVDALFQEE